MYKRSRPDVAFPGNAIANVFSKIAILAAASPKSFVASKAGASGFDKSIS